MNTHDVIRRTKARHCLDCGKCTAVCPVNRYDANFSPRLIVRRALRHAERHYSDPDIWSCIGCNTCTARCNYGVDYVDLIRHLRLLSRQGGTEMVFTHGGLTESVMHIMGDGSLTQDRIGWIPGDIRLEPGSGTAFFTGCAPYFDAIFSDLGVRSTEGAASAMRLLNLAAVPFDVLASERCCGHDLLLAGDAEGFLELGRRNAAEFKERGIRRIITSCPECYHTLKTDYPRYIGDWPCEVVHILELPAIYDIKQERNPVDGKKVTYHDPCSLGRRLKLYDSPRKLLAALPGAEVIEMDDNRENALCCGASPWAFCGAVNKQIQDERLKQAAATGADCLVTACPKCLIHLTCAGTSGDGKYNGIEITDLYSLLAPGPAAKETHL